MHGLMMDKPLLISDLLARAERHHGDTQVVSRDWQGRIARLDYISIHERARRLGAALLKRGIVAGDRIATLAWNGHRHLECYYAISGIGAVTHTVNPRLFPEQISWIVNDAQDAILFFDPNLTELVERLYRELGSVRQFVFMGDARALAQESPGFECLCYEDLIAEVEPLPEWPMLEERTASGLCYTSGTTGNPKGVLYHHRSTVLHAMLTSMPDMMNLSARDVVMPVVPMFHVNAWGLPYSCVLSGAKLVMPGPKLDGQSLFELFENEKVTLSAGVPTVWLGLLDFMESCGKHFSRPPRLVIGGSACPPAMIRRFRDHGVQVLHAWGMTEMSPIGSVCTLKGKHADLSEDAQLRILEKAGRPHFGVEMKIVDGEGNELPRDGSAFGDLHVRGLCVLSEYYKGAGGDPLKEGWFPTGDVATIDRDGYIQITDRSKDVIKSGGEWISSIDLENIAITHPDILEAAAIGVAHQKWGERPVVFAVRKPGSRVTERELQDHYSGKVAKFWMPDAVRFVDELPHTATGKLSKLTLRQQYRDLCLDKEEAGQ